MSLQSRTTMLITTVIALGFLANCAIFTSISTSSQSLDSISTSVSTAVGSISRSVSSISRSSSPKSQAKELIFQKDVETLVSLYGKNPELATSMEMDIARLAMHNGILDWDSFHGTYSSIGKGLRKAGLNLEEVQAIVRSSCPGKEELQDAILEGYGV